MSTNVSADNSYGKNSTINYGSKVTLTTNELNANWSTSYSGRFISQAMWLNFPYTNSWLEIGISDGGWYNPITQKMNIPKDIIM